ncbi:MAG: ATP-binding cassette domain-containing protein [Gammaproteobacteria bacterium]
MNTVLETRNLHRSFGAVSAACDINVVIHDREVVGIIGANGAGKTTFVNMVTGYVKPSAGQILFQGRDITALGPRETTAIGIARSFQVPQLFPSATVAANLMIALGVAEAGKLPLWAPLYRRQRMARCAAILERFRIHEYHDQTVRTLPQGVRKLLDIAMAMVHAPRLVLLDEPTSGISATEKFALMDVVIGALREERVTVLFIEHDMDIVGRYAERLLAFYDGAILADAPTATVLADAQVRQYIIGATLRRGERDAQH